MSDVMGVGSMPVSALVSDNAVRVSSEANLLEVARVLVDADIGILIVGGGEHEPLGVVSERDVVHALANGRNPETTSASEVVHTELAWCDATATVAEVAEEMMRRYVRHVLVEEDGCLVGVVSARDLLGVYASADLAADNGEE